MEKTHHPWVNECIHAQIFGAAVMSTYYNINSIFEFEPPYKSSLNLYAILFVPAN